MTFQVSGLHYWIFGPPRRLFLFDPLGLFDRDLGQLEKRLATPGLNNFVIVLCFPLYSFLIVGIIYTYLCFSDSRKYVVTWNNFPNKFVRSFIVPETKFFSSLVCAILKRENIGASVFITAIWCKKNWKKYI